MAKGKGKVQPLQSHYINSHRYMSLPFPQIPGVFQHLKPLPAETTMLHPTLCFMDQAWDTKDQVPNQQGPLWLASSFAISCPEIDA